MKFGDCWNKLGKDHWQGMWNMRKQMHAVIASLVLKQGKEVSVFEIGGAYGFFYKYLRGKGWTGSFFGIDISKAGIKEMRKQRINCVAGDFMEDEGLPYPISDVCVIEGVIDHQEKWYPMVLKAFECAPYVIVGVRKWNDRGPDRKVHNVMWRKGLVCWDNLYCKDLLLEEAKKLGLLVVVTEFLSPDHGNRTEVVLEFRRDPEITDYAPWNLASI